MTMIGRLYSINVAAQAQTAAKTLMEIQSPADSVTLIERIRVGQSNHDASENLSVKVQDVSSTGTGTSTTPRPMQTGDAAFGGTCKTNMTVEPTYGTATHIHEAFNVLSGYLWTPANDDEIIVVSPSALVGIKLDTAPSTSMDFSYGASIREIGG
jgi:hypothetical protein